MAATKKKKTLSFKEKPLMRSGNMLYFGKPESRFLTRLSLIKEEKFQNDTIPTSVSIELLDTENPKEPKLIMKGDRDTLYDALDIASIWIERAQDANA